MRKHVSLRGTRVPTGAGDGTRQTTPGRRERRREHRRRAPGGDRLLLRGGVVATVTALIAATVAIQPAAAAPSDVAESEGVLLGGSGLVNADAIVQLAGAYSARGATSGGGTTSQPVDVTALNAVNVNLGNDIDLLGSNGILTLGAAGQYATSSASGATGSSGLITGNGGIGVGNGANGSGASLNLDPLLSRVGANSSVLADGRLEVGALASTISATRGTSVGTTSDYQIAGAKLNLQSPAVSGLTTSLRSDLRTFSSGVNSTIGANGALSGITGQLTTGLTGALSSLGLISLSGTTAQATVNLNLDDTLTQVLAQPLTSGAVTITPATGAVSVDLDQLTALNGQPANTPVLTQQAVTSINTAIADILERQLPSALQTAVVNAINSTAISIRVTANATLAGLPITGLTLNVATTLGQLLGTTAGTPTVTASGLTGAALAPLLTPVVNTTLIPLVRGVVGPLLTGDAITTLGQTLTTTTTAVANLLSPAVLLLRQVIDLTVNAQDTTTGFRDPRGSDAGARSVHALRLSILPGANVATVDLATSTVHASAVAPVTIATPTANQQFSVPSASSTRSVTVSGAGEPGATIAVDLGAGRTGTATVAANGTWTTSIANVPTGDHTATATQTVGGATAGTATQPFSVVAQQALTITTPTAGQTFTITGASAPVTLTGTATPNSTVAVDLGGGRTGTGTTDGSGAWSVTVPGVPAGGYTASVTQTVGDSTSNAVTRGFRVVQAAGLTVATPTDGQVFPVADDDGTRDVPFSGTAQPGATVAVDAGDGHTASTTAGADGTWSTTVTGIPAGDHTASVTQTVGGSTSDPVERAFSVTAAAALTITTPTDGSVITVADASSTTPVTVSGSAAPDARVSVGIGGAFTAIVTADDDGDWTTTFQGVPVGGRTVTATQTVGGTTSAAVTSTFSVSAGDPLVITAPADGAVVTVLAGTTTDLPVSGTAEAGADVAVDLGGGRTASTTADDDGDWSVTVDDVPAGRYTIAATQTVNGTTSPVLRQVVTVRAAAALAVTAPAQGSTTTVAQDSSTIDVPVTGTAEPRADVSVVVDGGTPVSTTADDSGAWSVTLPDVGTGDHTVSVTQTVGGQTSAAVDRDFSVEAGDALTIDTPTDAQEVPAGGDGTAGVIASGTAEAGATVTVVFDDGDPITVTAGADGRWTAPATGSTTLGIGSHTVSATQTVNGTDGPTVERDFTVVPGRAITIDTPPTGSRFVVVDADASADVTITGTAEPGADVSVSVGGSTPLTTTADATSGAWTVTAEGLAPTGTYTVNATQSIEDVETSALPTTFQVVTASPVRITAPGADATTVVAGPDVTTDVTVSGTAQPGATITAGTDGADDQTTTVGADGTWSVTFPGLGVGEHPVSVTQTIGDATSSPVDRTVRIEAADPVTVTDPAAGDVLYVVGDDGTRDVTVRGTAAANAPVTVRLGDDEVTTTANGDGDWTVTFTDVGVGVVPVTATQTVNGTTASSPDRTVDVRAADGVVIDAPTDGQQLTVADPSGTADVRVAGTAQAGADVTVTLSDGSTHTVTAGDGGDWEWTFADKPVGDYRVTATERFDGQTSPAASVGVSVVAGAALTVTDPAGATRVTVADGDATTDLDFSGTGAPGATVTVDLGAGGSATATVDDDGDWAATVEGIPTGSWTASVTQALNGTTSAAVERPVSVVPAADLTIRQPDADEPITVADADQTTTVTVAGDAQPGATVSVTIDDRDPVDVTAGPDGTWALDVDGLGVGDHDVSVTQTVAGSTSTTPVESTFTVEAGAPVEVTTPETDQEYTVADDDATTTITVSGTAEPGATVVVDLGGGRSESTTAGTGGAWSVDVADVGAGDPVVSVTQRIGDTESAPVTVPIHVVVADPITIATPVADSTIRVAEDDQTTTVTATGAAQPGATVRVTLDDGDQQTVTATDAGTWSVEFDGVGTGQHTVRATQTTGGSTSAPVTSRFTVAGATTLAIDAPAAGSTITVPAGATGADVVVNGSGQPGATVRVVADGRDPVETIVGQDGRWTTTVDGLGEGDHTLSVTQVVNGTTSDPVGRGFSVAIADADAIVVTSPAAGTTYRVLGGSTDVTVTGAAAPDAPVSVTIDGGTPVTTTANGDGAWTVTVPGVGEGQHTIRATQTVGGTDVTAPEVGFSVVAATPVSVTSPADGQVVPTTGGSVSIPVSGTAEPGATVTVDIDGTTVTTTAGTDGSWTVTVGDVPPGDHTVSVTETVGGRTSDPVTSGVTVVVAEPEDVVITSPVPGQLIPGTGAGDTGSFTVTGHATPGATITVTLSTGQVRTTTADANGNWSVSFDRVPEGRWTIRAVQTVNGTNSTAPEVPIVVRAVDPLAVTSPPSGSHRTTGSDGYVDWPVTGTAEPGATVTVTADGGDPVTVTAGTDGTWRVVLRLAVGTHRITATQTVDGATSEPQVWTMIVDAAVDPGGPGTPGTPGAPGAPGTPGLPGSGPGNGNGGSGNGVGSTAGGLAFTGADVAPLAGAAGGLVVLGFLLLGLSRLARGIRRRNQG
ncbi:beta strand repeat-containing protein [Curtobacterium sp. NPDC090217]|uniref:beta strand repeat-containing protein n=1 Tax=Curtobacterium sp. NPDC090217 TaxID=3363970 RepID=UPI00382457BB